MGSLGLRSLLTAALWVAMVGAIVALHSVQPPAGLTPGGERWTLIALNPPAVTLPHVTLPHQWVTHAPTLRAARYETTVELKASPGEPWAAYIPSLSLNAAVFVNGARIGDGGSMQEPLARHSFRPLLFPVPAALLHGGANHFAVEVRSEPEGSGFLQQVYLGPQTQLQPYYDLRLFLNVQFVYGVMVAVLVLGAIMLGVWSGRRTERVYLWYAITSVTFLVYCLCLASSSLSLPSLWWDWLLQVSRTWMIAAITVFGIHFLGLSRPRMVAFLGWYSLVGSLALAALALVSPERFSFVSIGPWNIAGIVFCLYPVSLFVRQLWRRTDAASFWMLASASSLILGGGHDVLMENGLFAPFDGHYFHFMVPLAITTFTWILIGRFLRALEEAETLNRELNQRVLQKQAELERTYDDLKRSEQQRTLADERERIQRDMHDGIGGTLVSTLAGLEMEGASGSSAAQSLRSALDDLRLMIYSLDQDGGTLRAALGMLRDRLTRLGEDAGLVIEWRMESLPAGLALDRGATLQVMRIVQEAFTNTLKHARAQLFSLQASLAPGPSGIAGVVFELQDNGTGFDPASIKSSGYGFDNMRVRARKLNGTLVIEPVSPGTLIRLWIPA